MARGLVCSRLKSLQRMSILPLLLSPSRPLPPSLQDPHFKAANHRRRIIQRTLLAEYAYLLQARAAGRGGSWERMPVASEVCRVGRSWECLPVASEVCMAGVL